jgi:DNA-directed RNA polymerase specialized sigma24 family protein
LYNYFNFSDRIAKDVTQEVFLHVWNKLDKYKVEWKFEPRLYRLAHNLSIDWLKKHSKNEYDFIAPTVKLEDDR